MSQSTLRIASCQFPVTSEIKKNASYIRRFMKKAATEGAHLLHSSEACLSGYGMVDFPNFKNFDWSLLRDETARLQAYAKELGIWLILGSSHYLDKKVAPTNCLYIINPKGEIVDRYDKCMLTVRDQKCYTAGNRLVTRRINGLNLGFAICYDSCYPQIYAAYREKKVDLMLHSFYNAGALGETCLCELTKAQIPTRCADNVLWAVANNSTRRYSAWGSFVARPDATIAKQLPRHRAGMLLHDFPDTLPENGWIHNAEPLKLAKNQKMQLGKSSTHPRQVDTKSKA
ncbi:MAG: carbon-nitrogen hydrolase family protein [Lentisphaeria bacterium]|nr:carbon-nitrogen hydrolase family protein [Lentisphaeria bacterium]NQZ71400.1 carbon-nitrogen hydrolase family protein [Lentisphaeria bacterium]